MKKLILIFTATLLSAFVLAQDPHLSQYDASPIVVNPALTGTIAPGNLRGVTQYRNQWGTLGTRFTTSTVAFDAPIDKQFGVGLYLQDDNGAKTYNTFSLVLSGSYKITSPIQRKYRLMVGLQAGFIYKKTNESQLTFDKQYNSGVFNQELPSGEDFPKLSAMMPEFNVGFAYESTVDNQTVNPYAGMAVFHCSNPKESFYGMKDSRLPIRAIVHGGSKIAVNDDILVDPNLLLMKQRNIWELIVGARGEYKLNSSSAVAAGIHYRLKDAVIVMTGFNYNNYRFRISYDITVSELRKYTRGFGGLEFSLLYTGTSREAAYRNF